MTPHFPTPRPSDLKGAVTCFAAPRGQTWIAPPASSWLATAGTGDILARMRAAQLAAVGDPVTAACNAAWLHAEVARRAGPALVADDLIGHIPAALATCLSQTRNKPLAYPHREPDLPTPAPQLPSRH